MEKEHFLSSGPLLNEEGNLVEAGYSYSLVKEYDRSSIKAKKSRIKEWDYYYIGNAEHGIAFTIDDNSYMDLVSCTVLDFVNHQYFEKSKMSLFSFGRQMLPSSSVTGDTIYHGKRITMKFLHEDGKRHIIAVWPDFGKRGEELRADLVLEETSPNSIVMCTPFNKTAHFYYNQKINNLRVSGYAKLGEVFFDFNKDTYGVLDWGRGVWTYKNTWYWSSSSGMSDGHLVGWNLGYGFGDTSAASENVLFVDKKAYKLDNVKFIIPVNKRGQDDYMHPWRFVSRSGDIDLKFTPEILRHGGGNALLINSNQNQVFGTFQGRFLVDEGQTEIKIDSKPGFAEKVFNRW